MGMSTRGLFAALIVLVLPACASATANIKGAGATFPAPVIKKWADAYAQETGETVAYEALGSAEGIRLVSLRDVEFAVSDIPLTSSELAAAKLLQFPIVVGGVVPIVNIPGLGAGELRLTGPTLAAMYMGEIVRWNDEAIKNLNPGISLPDLPIIAIHRADGSGTTFLFTSYLSAVSSRWRERYGAGSSLRWPLGRRGKGNEGVATLVRDLPGALGYVEYAYAVQYRLSFTQLQNKAGRYLSPSETSFRHAASEAKWTRSSFFEILTDRGCPECWPITGASYALLPQSNGNSAQGDKALRFFAWISRYGGQAALDSRYVPVEDPVLVNRIKDAWTRGRNDVDGNSAPVR